MQALRLGPSAFQTILLINDKQQNKTFVIACSVGADFGSLWQYRNAKAHPHSAVQVFGWWVSLQQLTTSPTALNGLCVDIQKSLKCAIAQARYFSSVEQFLSLFNLPAIVLYLYVMVVLSVTFGSGSHTKDCKNGRHCLPAWNSASGVDLVTFVHWVIPAAAQRPLRWWRGL